LSWNGKVLSPQYIRIFRFRFGSLWREFPDLRDP
jgi:hypothetical protein